MWLLVKFVQKTACWNCIELVEGQCRWILANLLGSKHHWMSCILTRIATARKRNSLGLDWSVHSVSFSDSCSTLCQQEKVNCFSLTSKPHNGTKKVILLLINNILIISIKTTNKFSITWAGCSEQSKIIEVCRLRSSKLRLKTRLLSKGNTMCTEGIALLKGFFSFPLISGLQGDNL